MFVIPGKNMKRVCKKAIIEPHYAWRAAQQRMKSLLTYHLFNGESALPETISLFLTHRCNLRCKMCGQWGESGASIHYDQDVIKSELDPDTLKQFISQIAPFKPNITLFGGEPFLYRHWEDVVSAVKNHKMRVNVITNGTMLPGLASKIIASGLDEIIISIDGPQAIHDRIKQTTGSFQKIMQGIDRLNHQKTGKYPIINMTTVITEDNYEHLDEVIAIAEKKKANSLTFHHPTFIHQQSLAALNTFFENRFAVTCEDWAGFVRHELPAIDPDKLLRKMHQINLRRHGSAVSFYPNFGDQEIIDYYTKWNFRPTSYPGRCRSPWMVAYIFPDGSVRPFHSMNFSAGNIKNSSFTDIWNNARYRDFRRELKKKKLFSVCTRCTELYRY